MDCLLAGVDVLIHMAGTSVKRPLPEVIENNLVGLHAICEGARRHRVRRIVLASSNHAIGVHGVGDRLELDCGFRPDGFYGLSKMWGEGLARLYWDKHGIEGVCVRIGSAVPRPTEMRHLSIWFGLDNLLDFILRCIDTPEVGFLVAWGVSANTRSYWSPTSCERLVGDHPKQNAENFAAASSKAAASPTSTSRNRNTGTRQEKHGTEGKHHEGNTRAALVHPGAGRPGDRGQLHRPQHPRRPGAATENRALIHD